jgi:hypothetical protein
MKISLGDAFQSNGKRQQAADAQNKEGKCGRLNDTQEKFAGLNCLCDCSLLSNLIITTGSPVQQKTYEFSSWLEEFPWV